MDGFSKIDTGFGVWWIKNEDWYCPEDEPKETPYVIEGDLRYIADVPYFPCIEFDKDNVRKSQIATMAMCLSALGIRSIETYEDYLELLLKNTEMALIMLTIVQLLLQTVFLHIFAAVLVLSRYKILSMMVVRWPFKFPIRITAQPFWLQLFNYYLRLQSYSLAVP